MRERSKTPDIIIERAVELWCRAIRAPRFDNGDNSPHGFAAMGLHGSNVAHDLAKVDDFDAAVERFRKILTDRLKYQRDHEGELTGRQLPHGGDEVYRLKRKLSVDYGPDRNLAEAAEEAGLPTSVFSWKSDVSFWEDTHVSAKFGYAAEDVNHYPLADGSWLICCLRGPDMPKIIKAVEEGRLTDFTVERAQEKAS